MPAKDLYDEDLYDIAEHISTADTAKLVRAALKARFPGVRFSVRSLRGTWSNAISVSWTDGPSKDEVNNITEQYEGGNVYSDPYSDLWIRSPVFHWLLSDGTTVLTFAEKTYTEPEIDNRFLAEQMPDDAKLVRFGANDIDCFREDRTN